MRKNYFLSLLLLMSAFWNVEAKEREISKETAPTSITMMAPVLPRPTELSGTSVSGVGTQINLVWRDNTSGGNQETSFQIAISSNGGTSYSFNSAGPSLGAFAVGTLPGLTPGATYKIAVRAVKAGSGPTTFSGCTVTIPNEVNNPLNQYSCWSDIITVSTNPTVPTTPSNVLVLDHETTQTQAKLYFNDNSTNEQGFYISRSTNGGPWVPVVTLPAYAGTGQRVYVDNGLQDASYHRYQIAAYNVSGLSTVVESRQFETLPYAPQAPSILISPWTTLNTIRIEWTFNSTNQTATVIQRSNDGVNFYDLNDSYFPFINWYEDAGLGEGQTFWYRVMVVNKGGRSGPSNVIQATTQRHTAPPSPYDLMAKTMSPYRIDLNWSNAIPGPYDIPVATNIYRSTNGTNFVKIGEVTPEQFTYSDTTGKPKTKYWYRLGSANTYGENFSNVATATTLGPPSMPTNLQVIATKDSLGNDILVARWNDASDDEDYFVLERATDVNFTQNLLTANLLKNYTSATSIPFDEGVNYFFRIRAVNEHGSSEFTDWTSVTSFYTAIPNKPYALKATAAGKSVTLTWGDDSNKEEGFEVERSTDGANFGKITTTAANAISYVDNTVANSTKYWYRVRAVNPKGTSAYTDTVSVTIAAATQGLVARNDISNEAWQVYPNPTVDAVQVTLPESMQNQVGVVTIVDKTNREVIKAKLNSNQKEYRFDLSNFSEGTYIINISTGSQQISKRVYKF
ncbi:T9SS type A sorting domain-containing protein [Emticicia sp. C21]|uniref:T9SS type A sorting domain-containing protein n=1 Tax=Emticicia sp. C21 TaxID=2302915 RepID=UPI000E351BBF|nr:T9SS type A sorting domain-containing protein [Emticicia sp. C21]RFS18211.1 T9SS C-terminal target domain-containing protein [Emticicia sp. C21]